MSTVRANAVKANQEARDLRASKIDSDKKNDGVAKSMLSKAEHRIGGSLGLGGGVATADSGYISVGANYVLTVPTKGNEKVGFGIKISLDLLVNGGQPGSTDAMNSHGVDVIENGNTHGLDVLGKEGSKDVSDNAAVATLGCKILFGHELNFKVVKTGSVSHELTFVLPGPGLMYREGVNGKKEKINGLIATEMIWTMISETNASMPFGIAASVVQPIGEKYPMVFGNLNIGALIKE
jgi:hypothetical protein